MARAYPPSWLIESEQDAIRKYSCADARSEHSGAPRSVLFSTISWKASSCPIPHPNALARASFAAQYPASDSGFLLSLFCSSVLKKRSINFSPCRAIALSMRRIWTMSVPIFMRVLYLKLLKHPLHDPGDLIGDEAFDWAFFQRFGRDDRLGEALGVDLFESLGEATDLAHFSRETYLS